MDLVDAFRVQSAACRDLGSPMYAALLARAAEDLLEDPDSPVRAVLAGHEDDPGPSALTLRLLGSVHRLVLERRAGPLATCYPSVGGTWDLETGWPAFRRLLAEQPDAVRAWLDRPPQTNEVGRAAALYGGLLHLPLDLPVRLVEIGASAGLNLLADRFTYLDDHGRAFGAGRTGTGAVVLAGAWRGRPLTEPRPPRVVERWGADLAPLDPATTEGRLVLTAYVWPDQAERLERLRAALRLAQEQPVTVHRQDACSCVERLALVEGTTTVVWHSVMWQYLSAADQHAVTARLDELGAGAGPGRRLAHLRAEPSRRSPGAAHEFLVRLRTWPGPQDPEDRVIARTVGHGLPTTWE